MKKMNFKLGGLLILMVLTTGTANAETVETTVIAPGFFEDVSGAPDGNLYMPGPNSVIYQVTPEGSLSTYATLSSGGLGGAVASDGELYMSLYAEHKVVRVNPDGTTDLVASNIAGPTGIAPSNDPDYIYVVSYIWGALYKVNTRLLSKVLLENGPELVGPDGLAVDEDENLYLANFNDSRIHKRTAAGEMSLLATLPGLRTGYLEYADGVLYVAGLSRNVIYKVDAVTGSWSVFAGTGQLGHQDGPAETATFSSPNGLGISPDKKTLYIGEENYLRQIALDSPAPVVETIPTVAKLQGAAPNPFNPRTTVHFSLRVSEEVQLKVLDLRGHEVAILHSGRLGAGEHKIEWNGLDRSGLPVASGTYLAALVTSSGLETKPMSLVR